MLRSFLMISLFIFYAGNAFGTLAGGRPNTFSAGLNAFAGIVNPANAVWIKDRFDVGLFWVHQTSTLNNLDDNPLFRPGKTDFTYRAKNLVTVDAAFHKQLQIKYGKKNIESSFSIAAYTMPGHTRLQTKYPNPISGTTPILILEKTQVLSTVFSFKINEFHSLGLSIDFFHFTHQRNGFQRADNPLRSVSPGHVTNNGRDHSNGAGLVIGWRWRITEKLDFGTAWTKKSYCGQYRKYRGFEPHYANNYTPQTLGAGFSYRFNDKLAGRFEVLWSNLSNLPKANNSILPDGRLNSNKRGSNKSPGPGLQDATYLNFGVGYKLHSMLSLGVGYSHRLKLNPSSSFIISHSYRLQTIYDLLTFGANLNYQKHDLFLSLGYGFKNKVSGTMPEVLRGGRFRSEKQNTSLSISYGYKY